MPERIDLCITETIGDFLSLLKAAHPDVLDSLAERFYQEGQDDDGYTPVPKKKLNEVCREMKNLANAKRDQFKPGDLVIFACYIEAGPPDRPANGPFYGVVKHVDGTQLTIICTAYPFVKATRQELKDQGLLPEDPYEAENDGMPLPDLLTTAIIDTALEDDDENGQFVRLSHGANCQR